MQKEIKPSSKEALEDHLVYRESELFPSKEKIFLYDLTNTHFEGKGQGSRKLKYGRSKQLHPC